MPLSILKLTEEQKELTHSLVKKLEQLKRERKGDVVTLSFEELEEIISPEEKAFMEAVLNIDPSEFGVSSEFLGIEPPPEDLITITGQKYTWEGEEKEIAPQYLPRQTYEAFEKMSKALKKDTGGGLFVKSGYRSPAYQLLTFIYWLQKHNFDLQKTLAQSTVPGYSEHGYPPRQAIDFMNTDGVIWGDKICFDETDEYKWLLNNASRYGFFLSYPKDNDKGMVFEPWHWHYNPKT